MAAEHPSSPDTPTPHDPAAAVTGPVTDEQPTAQDTQEVTLPREPLARADWLAGTCFFLSGFLALVYEICWIRKASLVFGNTTFAVSTVVAVFLGGLAIGSYLFGKRSRYNPAPLKTYAKLEIWVGILAALTPILFQMAAGPFGMFYDQWTSSSTDSPAIQLVLLPIYRMTLITACILPATILIGGTLPLFVRQYVRHNPRVARPVGWLYGINTLGAACGCAACGFLMIPVLGIHSTIYLAAALNLGIGLIAWNLKVSEVIPYVEPVIEEEEEEEEEEASNEADTDTETDASDEDTEYVDDDEEAYYDEEPWTPPNPSVVMAGLFFMSGFAALANEILWTRFLSLLLHNTVYTYTLTLTVILLGIFFGSLIAASRFDRVQRHGLLFGIVQAASALLVLVAMLLPPSLWLRLADPTNPSSQIYLIALIMLVPSILSGMSLPLAIRFVVDEASQAGLTVGRMVALNTIGGICGSLLIGFILLPYAGMAETLKWTTGVGLLAAIGAWLLLDSSAVRLWLVIGAAACWLGIPRIMPTQLPRQYLAQSSDLVDHREGIASTVSIIQDDAYKVLEIDRLWQGTSERTHQALAAHIPAILHEQPEDVLVVGMGPGQTAQRFLMHGVTNLDVVEIEPSLVELLQLHTEDFKAEWLMNPAVEVFFDDGRNYITHTRNQYDIISIEIGQVFRPGLGSFYTREFYQLAQNRLKQNGIICQFVPIKFLEKEHFRSLVGTFIDVFPNSVLWYNTSELLLMGSPGDPIKLSPARLSAIETNETLYNDLAFAYWGGPDHYLNQQHVFLGGFLAGPEGLKKLAEGATRQRDNRPELEYMRPLGLPERAYHKPIVEIIQANLADPKLILTEKISESIVEAANMVRDENLRSIVSAAHLEIGSSLLGVGDPLGAQAHLLRAVNFLPAYAEASYFLGDAHAATRNLPMSISFYQQALNIRPDFIRAHTHMAFILRQLGQIEGAVEHFQYVIDHTPWNIHALIGLSQIRSTHPDAAVRNAAEALKLANSAFKYTQGTNAQVLMALGDAFAANGQFDQAIQASEAAVQLMGGGVQTEAIRQRLAFYRQKRPYIEQPTVPNQPLGQGTLPTQPGPGPATNPGVGNNALTPPQPTPPSPTPPKAP